MGGMGNGLFNSIRNMPPIFPTILMGAGPPPLTLQFYGPYPIVSIGKGW